MTVDEVAAHLFAKHPAEEPLELDPDRAGHLIEEATMQAPSTAFMAQVLVAWEGLIP